MTRAGKRTAVLHPFLFSLFPILALYAHNIRSIPIPLKELAVPMGLSITAAAALFLLFSAVFKEPAKAGVIASLVVLWILSFGHLAGWIAVWTGGLFNRSLFFATAILVCLTGYFAGRSRRSFDNLSRVLNVVSMMLVLLNAASVAQTLARRTHTGRENAVSVTRRAAVRPNIYYIVLDAYTRADILEEVFSFDNAPFLSSLESRGFLIAERSYANYNLTHQSLASSLNFAFLDRMARDAGYASSDREPLYAMIRENRAMSFLRSQGYRIVTVSSSLEPTDFPSADRYFGFARSESEFRSVLLDTTPWPLFFESRRSAESYDAHRGRILNAFAALEESAVEKGPFFLFVHIMAPHPPFVFGPRGEAVEPAYLFSMVDADRLHGGNETAMADYISRYRDQLAFLNTKLLEAVDTILERSPTPPIVVLQGDHGSRAYADLDRPEASYFKENLAILNAYHLPGTSRDRIYPGISPVNTFRLIFKTYFDAELDLLPDASAWTTWRRPYRFLSFEESAYKGTIASVKTERREESPAVQMR